MSEIVEGRKQTQAGWIVERNVNKMMLFRLELCSDMFNLAKDSAPKSDLPICERMPSPLSVSHAAIFYF